MRIAYDGSGLTPPRTGVGNYIEQLLTHLVRDNAENDYWLLAHRRAYVDGWVNQHKRVNRMLVHFPNRFIWMQLLLPAALRQLHPDVVHFPNFVAPLASDHNLVVTVHDISLLRFPGYYSPRQRILMRPLIVPTMRRARRVITISEQIKREIVQSLHLAPARVQVIHESAAPAFFDTGDPKVESCRRARYGWDDTSRHLLYVGTLEPRKNVTRLVSALHLLHTRGTRAHLWLVGQAGRDSAAVMKRVQELGLERFVHLTGYVPTQDLVAFYRGCDLFVYPSLYEGFGLPVLEAMACGAPVALADIPTFREVADTAAVYFVPYSVVSIVEAIQGVMDVPLCAEELRVRARARAAQFSWERTARETYAVYREIAEHRTA